VGQREGVVGGHTGEEGHARTRLPPSPLITLPVGHTLRAIDELGENAFM
jgi:hypothetical protein